jgi:ABC-2 type transport system ATP-binding protein
MIGAMIETVGAARWYGQVIAVNDVTLSIGPGVTGLLGPNGAGKSTLMKMMVGQLRPSRGEVRVLGEKVFGNRALMRRIGYAPEHEGTYEDLTGLEMVSFLLRLTGFHAGEAEKRAKTMLERLDLGAAMHRRLGEYSKGMRQRAKLAQALAHDPDVVYLDEPLTGCDPMARVRVLDVVKELAKEGRCFVVSSHVLYEIESLTSQILLIHKGQVLAEGDVYAVRELIDRHPHKVRVQCSDPRALGRVLVGGAHVLGLRFEPDAVIVETREPDRLYPAIPEAAREAKVDIVSLTSPDNNLASVFRYLTDERERPGAKGARVTPATDGVLA